MHRWVLRILAFFTAAALALSAPAFALSQGERVPAKLALLVMLKVLTYDKNLAARGGGDFVVLVATESGQEAMRREIQAAAKELSGAALQTRPVRFEYAEFSNEAGLKREVEERKAQAVLLLPGLSDEGLKAAGNVSSQLQIYSLGMDPSFVEKWLAVGVLNNGGRPQIVLNLIVAKQLNASFEPAVLKLAKLIQ